MPLLAIIVGFGVILRGGNVSNEQTNQWMEDILFAVLIIFPYGLYKAYWAVVALIRNDYSSESETLICLNCHELFMIHVVNKMICPKCTGVLENLDGFYSRHPELADKVPKQVRRSGRAKRNPTQ